MSSRVRSGLSFLVVGSMLCALLAVPIRVTAQESVAGESTGVSVAFADGWAYEEGSSFSLAGVDTLVFVNDSANFIVTAGNTDVAAVPDSLGISASDIDVGATYALQSAEANGVPFGIFSVVVGSNTQTVIAPVSGFGAAVGSAQSAIQIDSGAVLSGVDGMALQGTIASSAGSGDPSTSASPLIGASEAADSVHSPPASAEVSAEAASEENAFVAPISGATVTWSSDWQRQQYGDDLDYQSYVDESYTQFSWESFCLVGSTPDSASISICFYLSMNVETSPQEYWDLNFGENATGSYGLPLFGVVQTDNGFVFGDSDIAGSWAGLQQLTWQGDYLAEVRVYGTLENITSLLDSIQSGVTLDGEPVFGLIDPVTFGSEVEARIADFPNLEQQRDARLAEMGLVDANRYTSNAMGCDVEWSTAYQINSGRMLFMEPIFEGLRWNSTSSQNHPYESLMLAPTGEMVLPGIEITCMEPQDSMTGFWEWGEGATFLIEGETAEYSIQNNNGYYSVRMVLTPLGGPNAEMSFWASADGVAALQNAAPGTLLINGVDIAAVLQEDNLVDQLP